jgi:NitT/TauT family transport system substrate-binding protein
MSPALNTCRPPRNHHEQDPSMSSAPEPTKSSTPPGTTRIVAGESAKPRRRRTLEISLAAGLVLLIGAGAAVASTVSRTNETAAPAAVVNTPAAELRLGYFGNITHAPALVGVSQGLIAKSLGETKLSTQVFNAGPAAIEALNAGAIDATYIGPNPAINSYVKSKGESISIIAGAASGGAQLVVKPGITAADLKGKKLATPQLGGTQDVALRAWLGNQGHQTTTDGGGDVAINPTENAQTLKLFQDGKLDGAWLPEPWASRLVLQAGAKVLVDEKDLWEKGEFITTVLIVNKKFAAEHPDTVKALLKGHVESVDWLNAAPAAEKSTVLNAALKESAGAALPADVIDRSLKNIAYTVDPLAGTYQKLLQDGVAAGTTQKADINGIFDLTALNSVLSESPTGTKISAQGLGTD